MAFLLKSLIGGFSNSIKRAFHRPYGVFNIGWLEEKALKHRKDTGLKYHLYKNRYRVAFRDANEFLVSINELFINEFYKFKSDTDRPKIIDCGSYIGTSILYFKINYPNAVVTGFEPDPSNYSLLRLNLDNWAFSETEAVNAAIWINNESITFSSAGNMSSKIDADNKEAGGNGMVKCVRLSDLLNEDVDFLKIDIEGAELPVMRDCGDKIRNVKNLFVEYHGKYDRLSELNEILDILLRNDFKYCIREGSVIHPRPFWDKVRKSDYDMLLNIFAFRG
ncbi:MAG TPA: FkbM family methyltransferase [Puia sp.]|nr:FkbM family methyltransferase [Puia sp.]